MYIRLVQILLHISELNPLNSITFQLLSRLYMPKFNDNNYAEFIYGFIHCSYMHAMNRHYRQLINAIVKEFNQSIMPSNIYLSLVIIFNLSMYSLIPNMYIDVYSIHVFLYNQ